MRPTITIDNITYKVFWHSENYFAKQGYKLLSDGKNLYIWECNIKKEVVAEDNGYTVYPIPTDKPIINKITNGLDELKF